MEYSIILALPIFLIAVASAVDMVWGISGMGSLGRVVPIKGVNGAQVSIIVPACNEAHGVETAMKKLLLQDYPHIEIIAINDRSTDETGEILNRLAEEDHRLRVIHIEELPSGWLGKANALQKGADLAIGEYLLFTDGDIEMDGSTVSRAMGYMVSNDVDHLSLIFKNTSTGWLLNSLILDSGAGLLQMFRPWKAKDPSSRCFIGVGAFNMVRKAVYDQIGGHSTISMHPVDDIMLGKLIKQSGFRQDCLFGHDLVTVHWYESISQMAEGLNKNVLAMVNFRFAYVPILLGAVVYCNILPFWGMILTNGWTQFLFFLVMVIKLMAFLVGSLYIGVSPWCALGTIISPYITCYIIIRSTWRNYRDNGIIWRGTHYSLADLQKNERLLP